MGSTHVTMAMIGGAFTLPAAVAGGLSTPGEQAAWIIAWGGAGLIPDFDHPNAHAARMWGPVSTVLAVGVSILAGGHRRGTHDLVLAPIGFAVLATVALSAAEKWAAVLVLALMIGLSLRGLQSIDLGRVAEGSNLVISLGGAWWIVDSGHLEQVALLPLAIGGGVLCHLIGDGLTDEKLPVPIMWLLGREERIGLPLMATGKTVELACWAPGMLAILLWQLSRITGIHSFTGLRLALEDLFTQALNSGPGLVDDLIRVAVGLQ